MRGRFDVWAPRPSRVRLAVGDDVVEMTRGDDDWWSPAGPVPEGEVDYGYLLDDARQIRAAVKLPMVLLGGITNKEVMDRGMAEGFQFVAMARALLREPDLVNRIQADHRVRSLCNHNNRCMPTNFTGARCVLVDRATTRSQTWGTEAGYVGASTEDR